MSEITKNVERFYKSINKIKNHRYKSWEHCNKFFKKVRSKNLNSKELDLAQLHLAFYLASWGMYRGSSFILQKDYTIFKDFVKEILSKKYSLLWNVDKNLKQKNKMARLFNELCYKLKILLKKIRLSVKYHPDLDGSTKRFLNKRETISPTLITKIILGTIGCIPAYDRYFVNGLKTKKIQKKFDPKKSFLQMIKFYSNNQLEIDKLKNKFKGYPLMKILDMYFWRLGYNEEKNKK